MKAKDMMDKDFIYAKADNSIKEISIKMEDAKRFTTPVLDKDMKLIGWVTSLDITKGLREEKKIISEIMRPKEDVKYIHENDPSRLAVLETSKSRLISIPVLNNDDVVTGVIRSFEIVDTLSALYDVKVEKLYLAMVKQLKGVTWEELMEASAIIYRRTTGEEIKPEEYEKRIKNSTFGEAIWSTGGLERFFVGLIAVGELVIARRIGRVRK
ncbi:MAG: CBS domain-containing protein [Methanobrevibacter sp.]|jgi:predicted transcriptional regulator|nr:CBS domain-containing protein [Candidatus Methanovirga australis]